MSLAFPSHPSSLIPALVEAGLKRPRPKTAPPDCAASVENTVLAPPPVRESLPMGAAVPLEPPTLEEIEQEVQQLMSQTASFDADVVVIGSGPGGYVASIRAAQLGGRVVCIEKAPSEWGGTCLNWGCIPTKTMIASAERYQHVKHADRLGITIGGEVGYDFGKIMTRKDKVVSALRGGVEALLKSNHVRKVVGTGRISGKNSVEVTGPDGAKETITTKNIIIATGSAPIMPPIPGLERPTSDARGQSSNGIWTSDEAVRTDRVPKSLLIIGGGVVGCEFAYTFGALGTKVTVVELMEEIIPLADAEIAGELRKSLTRQGIAFHLGSKVASLAKKGGGWAVTVEGAKAGVIEADAILVGVGRRALLDEVGLDVVGIETDRRGIVVNEKMETSVGGIFAIGDVVSGGYALAHVASHQGVVASENCMGHESKMDYRAVPSPIFTEPEMATTGLSEKQAQEAGYDVVVGKFPFRPLGKAMAMDAQEGMVKIVSERKYGEVLGVHIVGPHASDLIHEGVAAIKLESTIEELMTMIHAHPTLAEAMLEAALDVKGEAIHKMRS
jgi:dihydrolipoamide dehydrogenase